ncbi:hypothetical protein FS837_001675 [Tulasnella sp. UAMH 9824]|nr:hypothetical protein FS837_001675 [Tulasnella sp. UAMH 9824]
MADEEPPVEINETEPETDYEGTSIRWKHFSTSYKLAAKKISMGWSYEDFAQCIPGWSGAQPLQASDVCKQMSEFIQDSVNEEGDRIFRQYHAAEGIDALHQVVAEGKARKAAGESPGKDAWTRVLEPKEAIRARVVPVLRSEKARLEAALAELENENDSLTDILKANKAKRAEQNALANQWLDALEEAAASFSKLPESEAQQWSIETQETRPQS